MLSIWSEGVSDADFWSPEEPEEYELSEAELEAEYLERIEAEAAALPPADFTLELSADWTDQDIAEYEAWLAAAEADEFPRIAPISVAVRMPAELEAA